MNLSSNTNVMGTCSLCGGLVISERDNPRCSSCGAQKKHTLPIVEMEAPNPKPQLLNE